jgi:DNA-binding transcriptional LysR family regulator
MNEQVDLITLRVIVTAADLGSISAASDRLSLAVAAASARISAMEESLALRIFERSSRGVQLTPAGRTLVERAREFLHSADRLSLDLNDYSQGLQGHVRVLANASAMLEVLPGRLAQFMSAHPLIRIDLEEQSSPDIPLALLEGRADLGIVDMAHPPAGLALQDFFSDTLVLIVPAQHRLAQREAIALNEALDEDFITLSGGTALSNRLMAAAADVGKPVRIRMRMRGFDAVCRMVAAGLGVGVLPMEAVEPQRAFLPIKAITLTDAWAVRTHRLAFRNTIQPSPATQRLIEALTAPAK